MGILSRLFGGAAAQPDFDCTSAPQLYIFDASGLAESGQKNNVPTTPRDNFEALKILAQFAAQEGLNLIAVFTGRPLREAAEGATYKNVEVHYAENSPGCRKVMMKLLQRQSGSRRAVVLTADPDLERMAAAQGADCMRISTFKKVFDNRESREGRDSRDNRDRRQPRPPRRNVNNGNGSAHAGQDQTAGEATEKATDAAPADETDQRPTGNADTPKKEILDLSDPL